MPQEYFKKIPNFEYISLDSVNEDYSSENYTIVKNLFKRCKIRDDIFKNFAYFQKYTIIGDERPDQIAEKIYGDSTLDWIILLSNNIQNLYDEWPKSQSTQTEYLLEKYGSYENLYEGIHHYETIEIKDYSGKVVIEGGNIVDENYYKSPEYVVESDLLLNLPSEVPGVFAQATASLNNVSGKLTQLNITNVGSGYTGNVTVTIDPPSPAATAEVSFTLNSPPSNREIGTFTIINEGSGYTTQPSLTFNNPDPTISCELESVVSAAGSITSINIINPGEGYTFIPTIEIEQPIDIFTNAILTNQSNFTIESSGFEGFYLDPLGKKLYTCHGNNLYTEGLIEYYELSVGFNITTGSKKSQIVLNINGLTFEYITGIEFKPDGKRFYVSGMTDSGFKIAQYDLSTPWDILTSTLSGSFSTSECSGVRFKDDGSRIFVIELADPDTLKKYELITEWDITTTIPLVEQQVNILSLTGETSVRGFTFRDDGSRLYISGTDTTSVHILNFGILWDLTKLTLVGSKDISSDSSDTIPLDVYTDQTETLLIVGGGSSNKLYLYDTDIKATATASLGIGSSSEQVTNINVTKSGSGYSQDNLPKITIQSPIPHRTAKGYVIITNNKVTDVIITDPGYNYKSNPTGIISPPLNRITATANASAKDGGVVQVSLTNPGLGYTSAPKVTFNKPFPIYNPQKDELFQSENQEWKYDGFDWQRRLSYGTFYTDQYLGNLIEVKGVESSRPVTNFEYEEKIENKKRSIYILKNDYLSIILDDIENIMPYKKGSEQYISKTLKKGYNPNLYE